MKKLVSRKIGHLYTWGESTFLGHNNCSRYVKPTRVMSTGDGNLFEEPIAKVSAGEFHCGFVTEEGSLYTFGESRHGELGHSTKFNLGPMKVEDIPLCSDVACGRYFTLALTKTGEVYSWGFRGEHSLLGRLFGYAPRSPLGYVVEHNQTAPQKVSLPEKVVSIAAGRAHCLAVGNSGKVYCWGSNDFGEVGNSELLLHQHKPTEIPEFVENENEKVQRVVAGHNTSAAVTSQGRVYVWGRNEDFELGVSDEEITKLAEPKPTLLELTKLAPAKEVYLGFNTIMLLSEIQTIWVAGMGLWNNLEDFELPSTLEPTKVCCGRDYFAALTQKNQVVYYGGPFSGEDKLEVDLAEKSKVTSEDFFPGKVLQLEGRYGYCAAVIDS